MCIYRDVHVPSAGGIVVFLDSVAQSFFRIAPVRNKAQYHTQQNKACINIVFQLADTICCVATIIYQVSNVKSMIYGCIIIFVYVYIYIYIYK